MTFKRRSKVYVVSGEARDQETIIRQRPQYEDYVTGHLGKEFSDSEMTWELNEAGNFEFRIEFYA